MSERNEVCSMKRQISIGNEGFENLREKKCFYIDKTSFIKQ